MGEAEDNGTEQKGAKGLCLDSEQNSTSLIHAMSRKGQNALGGTVGCQSHIPVLEHTFKQT